MASQARFSVGRCAAAITVLWILAGCGSKPEQISLGDVTVEADLAAHSKEFEQGVIEVTDGIHVAIGYGLANSIMISGEGCRIIVDTMESLETATAAKAALDAIDDSPIAALVYTHNHGDHVFGARAFAEDGEPRILAHRLTTYYLDRVLNVVRPIITVRSARMFGNHLDAEGLVNAGIGPFLGLEADSTIGPLRPTETFDKTLSTEACGVEMELVHAPGETDDQLFVWLPQKRALLPGDNLYKTFPNLYTIRGTPYRDVHGWVQSLDQMRALQPEHLVPSHTRPISGAEEIQRVLTDYRDAIQYVHDQTVRGMNQGLTPDELVETVRLPPHLAASPYLHELYGTVEWSVRSVFDGYLGWFDGNPTRLDPHPPGERARRFAELAGGEAVLLERAVAAAESSDHRWVLELTDHLLLLDPDNATARDLRVAALIALGEASSNPNARHYYMTAAAELRDGWTAGLTLQPTPAVVHDTPLAAIFGAMAVKLDPVASAAIDRQTTFVFPDTGEVYSVHVRRGVAEVQPRRLDEPDLMVTVDSTVWKEIVAELRSPAAAIATGKLDVDGGVLELRRFLALFREGEE